MTLWLAAGSFNESSNHDMQEDKEPLFDTISTLETSLFLMSKMIETMQINKKDRE